MNTAFMFISQTRKLPQESLWVVQIHSQYAFNHYLNLDSLAELTSPSPWFCAFSALFSEWLTWKSLQVFYVIFKHPATNSAAKPTALVFSPGPPLATCHSTTLSHMSYTALTSRWLRTPGLFLAFIVWALCHSVSAPFYPHNSQWQFLECSLP